MNMFVFKKTILVAVYKMSCVLESGRQIMASLF